MSKRDQQTEASVGGIREESVVFAKLRMHGSSSPTILLSINVTLFRVGHDKCGDNQFGGSPCSEQSAHSVLEYDIMGDMCCGTSTTLV